MRSLFLDTANIEEIREMVRTDAIAGVTTNPSLMAKEEKGDYLSKLEEICTVINTEGSSRKHLSVEVTTLDPVEMQGQALALCDALARFERVDLYIKIPVMLETLEVISRLTDRKVKINATACMTTLQAKLAEDAGAHIVSFFYNRMIDGGCTSKPDSHELKAYARMGAMQELQQFSNLKRSSQIICGSIREPFDVYECWCYGAEIVTASLKVIKGMVTHPKTTEAINQFQKDIDSWLK